MVLLLIVEHYVDLVSTAGLLSALLKCISKKLANAIFELEGILF